MTHGTRNSSCLYNSFTIGPDRPMTVASMQLHPCAPRSTVTCCAHATVAPQPRFDPGRFKPGGGKTVLAEKKRNPPCDNYSSGSVRGKYTNIIPSIYGRCFAVLGVLAAGPGVAGVAGCFRASVGMLGGWVGGVWIFPRRTPFTLSCRANFAALRELFE